MRKHLAAIGTVLALASTALAATPALGSTDPLPPLDPAVMQDAIAGLPNSIVTGALVNVTGPGGQWSGTSGVRDIRTGKPVAADGNFRVGSISKVFTAVVTLQLAAEGRVDLDKSVQHYLPGLLSASYPTITIRQLLNHTSGLPGGDLGAGDAQWFVDHRLESWTPRQIVADAVTHPMEFAPGTLQDYNGTNYYIAGLLIERITGHSYAHEVEKRVIAPLSLRNTYVLDRHDPRLPGPHAHGYVAVTKDGTTTLHDVSEQSPFPWAEGGLISNSADLARFISAIFQGRLVPRSELDEMFTVPKVKYAGTENCNIGPEAGQACYSAGLMKSTLPNGLTGWGKTGSRPGYTSGMFATRDLRRVLVYSLNPTGNKDGAEAPYVMKVAAATFDPDFATG
ncbi:serine hydrolase domain-containing protein [Actinomadura sp. DC4]|uniref:serine hydrolase domain-containing protein n=1 Tax=Actinomadura sp. DC4 TaxID=3055069 RepID=UPI0025B0EA61|nr:serine hydrolase domain-containing protein [Actinomadura sp. DC4]MDN3353899.1 serine hydrolase domain-containing protein [Actinomadura sp. DC4]